MTTEQLQAAIAEIERLVGAGTGYHVRVYLNDPQFFLEGAIWEPEAHGIGLVRLDADSDQLPTMIAIGKISAIQLARYPHTAAR